MKTILVPMDGSACAENAFLFAILLAQKLPAKILLVNAFVIPATAGEVPFEIIEAEISRRKKDAEQLLKTQAIKASNGGVPFECVALEGAPAKVITDVAKSHRADYIVMGTTGEGLTVAIFGGTATRVIEKASCPVMALPPGSSFRGPLKKITYATDYHDSDPEAIAQLVELARLWNAQMNILHVDDEGMAAEQEVAMMDGFRKKILQKADYNNLSFQILYGDDVAARLETYVEEKNTDLLVMSTHRRGFFERLFKRSITRSMAVDGAVPLMAFHYNSQSAVKLY